MDCSEPNGFASRVWVLWRSAEVQLIPIVVNFQIVILAGVKQGCMDWILSTVSASPNEHS